MFLNPSLVPAGTTIRNLGAASNAGLTKYMLSRYLRERGDANIKWIKDWIDKSKFYLDVRPEAGFVDRKAGVLEEINSNLTLDMAKVVQDRFANQQIVMQCMAQENLDAIVSPGGKHPRLHLGRTHRAAAADERWSAPWRKGLMPFRAWRVSMTTSFANPGTRKEPDFSSSL